MMIPRITAIIVAAYALFMAARAIWRGRRAARAPRWPAPAAPTSWPFVSVIIPAWKDRATLQACLRTVAELEYPAYEAIVVAGGGDGTYEAALERAAEDARLRVVKQLPRGKNAALNQGLALAQGEVIVLLDADSEVSPGWLKALVARLDRRTRAVTGNYFPRSETPIALTGELAKVAEYVVRGRVILQGSGGIALRRESLAALGPFPEARVSSDWDLDARVDLCGFRKAFAPDAAIRTHRPATLREWWRNEVRWRRLHLLSLIRLRDELLRDPRQGARHLLPYAIAWGVTVAWALLTGAVCFRPGRRHPILRSIAAGFTAFALLREFGSALEAFAYRPARGLLPALALSPALIILGWAACVVASLTKGRVSLQFKGARQTREE
jgi:cellulose synthase/poly-beta-1,6-N-acetylglucosamine synthase-like glycosyltransferase